MKAENSPLCSWILCWILLFFIWLRLFISIWGAQPLLYFLLYSLCNGDFQSYIMRKSKFITILPKFLGTHHNSELDAHEVGVVHPPGNSFHKDTLQIFMPLQLFLWHLTSTTEMKRKNEKRIWINLLIIWLI